MIKGECVSAVHSYGTCVDLLAVGLKLYSVKDLIVFRGPLRVPGTPVVPGIEK